MARERLIFGGEKSEQYGRDRVGGKGYNLLRLWKSSRELGTFTVPDFFVIPFMYGIGYVYGGENDIYFEDKGRTQRAFGRLKKPVIARSSSPDEDGLTASFAGMFSSYPNLNSWKQLKQAIFEISESSNTEKVRDYAEEMEVNHTAAMAYIVQEQVTDFLERGVIQLEKEGGIIEMTTPKGKSWSHEIDYGFLDKEGPWNVYEKPHDYIAEGEIHNACQCARQASKHLGLDGVVQVEYLLAPAKKPFFVQIRQLPPARPAPAELKLDVPKDAPCLESQVCNGVAGEVILPAYVTFSQSGFPKVLIESGHARADERMQLFRERSKLAGSDEFHNAMNFDFMKRIGSVEECISLFEKMWESGNERFPEYVLVCDKLDESICEMNSLTKNKRAIITCLEAVKTSHAMTVARDLGIPAMGVDGDIMDMDYFFNQIETGDMIHMKSNGKKAVAYIAKKHDPR